jgi:nicotinamidase-related amidase
MARNNIRRSRIAVLLIDVVNHFEFPDGKQTLRKALPIAPRLARLKQRAAKANIPVIYVNDNFGKWHSDTSKLVAYCLRPGCTGKPFVELIKPAEEDYCILKPMHSAFYQTPLDVLLRDLGVSILIIAGLTTNSCILCTAHDANMRDLKVTVVSDCCAARTGRDHRNAIVNIKEIADARVVKLASLRLKSP